MSVIEADQDVLGWAKVGSPGASAGAGSLKIDRLPGSGVAVPTIMVVGVGLPTMEMRGVSATSFAGGVTTSLPRPLSYAHSISEYVAFVDPAFKLPLTWAGLRSQVAPGTSGQAAINTTQHNRIRGISGEMVSGGTIACIADDLFYVNDSLYPMNSLYTYGKYGGGFIAHSSFPFVSDFSKGLVHCTDGTGIPTILFLTANHKYFFDGVTFDGNGITNSVGVIQVPEQPGHTDNCIFKGFRGSYGMYVGGSNFFTGRHNHFKDNFMPFVTGHSDLSIEDTVFEDTIGPTAMNISGSNSLNFHNVKLGKTAAPGPCLYVTGIADNIAISRLQGEGFTTDVAGTFIKIDATGWPSSRGTGTSLSNIRCTHLRSDIKMIDDTIHGVSFSTLVTDGVLEDGWMNGGVYFYGLRAGVLKNW